MRFVKYDIETGRLTFVGLCEDGTEMFQPLKANEQILAGPFVEIDGVAPDLEACFVDNGTIARRTLPPIAVSKSVIKADDVDEAVLSGFPEDTVVLIDGYAHQLQGGELRISSPMPATYKISCDHFPYLDWETTIEAVA